MPMLNPLDLIQQAFAANGAAQPSMPLNLGLLNSGGSAWPQQPTIDPTQTGGIISPTQSAVSTPQQQPSVWGRLGQGITDNSDILMALGAGLAGAPTWGEGISRGLGLATKTSLAGQKKGNVQATYRALTDAGVPAAIALNVAQSGDANLMKTALDKFTQTDLYRPATEQERQSAGAAPGTAGQVNLKTGKIDWGPAGINVALNTEKTGQEKLATETINEYKAAQTAGQQAQKRSATYAGLQKAAEGFQPGALAPIKLEAKRYLKDAGLIAGEDVPDAEAFQQLSTALQVHAQPQGQGAVSNYERELFAKGVPNMAMSPEGLKIGLGIAQRLDSFDAKVAQIWRDSAAKNNGVPNYLEVQNQIAALGSPLTQADYAAIKRYSSAQPQSSGSLQPGQSVKRGNVTIRRID